MEGRGWFKLFPAEFLAGDLALLDNEQFGALMRLLFHNWIAETLPSNPAHLARLSQSTEDEFNMKIWPYIRRFFVQADGENRITNPYLAEWEKHRAALSELKSKAGKAGGRGRPKAPAIQGAEQGVKQDEKGPDQTRPDQKRTEDPSGPAKPPRKKGKTPFTIPNDFMPDTLSLVWFRQKYGEVPEGKIIFQTEQFVERSKAKGTVFINWQAAWKTWMNNWMTDFGRKEPKAGEKMPEGFPEDDPNLVLDDDDPDPQRAIAT